MFKTLTMFIARILFFRLHESPRYLVHAGRPHEAIESLQLISKFNGSELSIDLGDIEEDSDSWWKAETSLVVEEASAVIT